MIMGVMFVLIIMIMATLTVVAAANRRVYTKYEENQAYYSARSALDIFIESLHKDKSHYAFKSDGTTVREYYYTPAASDPDYPTATANMFQGRALELELYKLSVWDEVTDAAVADPLKNMKAANWVDPALDPDGNFNNYSADPNIKALVYEVMYPVISTGTEGYGGMADIMEDDGDATTTEYDKAEIKVELIDRKYDGGADTADADTVKADKTRKGNRKKDIFTIRITSTVTYMDTVGVAVLECKTKPQFVSAAAENALTANNVKPSSAGFHAKGGNSTPHSVKVDSNNSSGEYFAGEDIEFNSSGTYYMSGSSSMTAMGDIKITNSAEIVAHDAGKVFFAGGNFITSSNVTFGTPTIGVNIIADNFILGNGASGHIYGNVYVNSYTTGNTDGATIHGNLILNEYHRDGNNNVKADRVYCYESLYLKSTDIKSGSTANDVRLNLPFDIVVSNNVSIYVDNILHSDSSGGTRLIANDGYSATFINAALDISIDPADNDFTTVSIEDSTTKTVGKYKKFTLPIPLAGTSTNELLVPTAQAMLSRYYSSSSFNSVTGDYDFMAGGMISAEDFAKDTLNQPFPASVPVQILANNLAQTATELNGEYLVPDNTTWNTWIPAGSKVKLVFGGNSYKGRIYIADDAEVNIYLTGSGLVHLGPSGYSFQLLTESLSGYSVNTGSHPEDTRTPMPKVNILAKNTVTGVQMRDNSLITGYVYAPSVQFELYENGGPIVSVSEHPTNGDFNYTNDKPNIIGSLACNGFYCQNGGGIVYLGGDGGGGSTSLPGEPEFTWEMIQYMGY